MTQDDIQSIRKTDNGWEITERSLRVAVLLFTVISMLVTLVVAWAGSMFAIKNKVDRLEFVRHEGFVNAYIEAQEAAQARLTAQQALLLEETRSVNLRVRMIYCDGKPPGCL